MMEHLGAFLDGCEYTICGGYVGATSTTRLVYTELTDSI